MDARYDRGMGETDGAAPIELAAHMEWMLAEFREAIGVGAAEQADGDQTRAQFIMMLSGYGVDLRDRCSAVAVLATVDYMMRISVSINPAICGLLKNDAGSIIDAVMSRSS